VSLFETSALTHTHTCPPSYFHFLSSSPTHILCIYVHINVHTHTHRLVSCSSTRVYVPIYICIYCILYIRLLYVYLRVCLCVWKHSRWRRRTWRRYLDWDQCCSEAIYNNIYVWCVARIAFFGVWKPLALCT